MFFFLRAKAWQLFVLMVIPYVVYKTTGFGKTPVTYGALWVYFLAVTAGWFFSIASASNDALPESLKSNLLYLKCALLIPLLHIMLFVFAVLLPWTNGEISRPPVWLVPMHFVAIFCYLFSLWFVSRIFITAREQRPVAFVEYYAAFMGLWVCFIGVWFLQPAINNRFASVD